MAREFPTAESALSVDRADSDLPFDRCFRADISPFPLQSLNRYRVTKALVSVSPLSESMAT